MPDCIRDTILAGFESIHKETTPVRASPAVIQRYIFLTRLLSLTALDCDKKSEFSNNFCSPYIMYNINISIFSLFVNLKKLKQIQSYNAGIKKKGGSSLMVPLQ